MEICILNSGSNGNAIYIGAGETHILIDAGISALQIKKRLETIGRSLNDLTAVLISHEHVDHCRALPTLVRRQPDIKIFANENTATGVETTTKKTLETPWNIFETGAAFTVGELHIQSFAVPHDTGDPVGYVVSDSRYRVGVATDLGTSTPVVKRHLHDCDVLVLETNHDTEMVRESGRPWSLIRRILGRHGHLSNEQAAELLEEVMTERLKVIFPAHLSDDCNTPDCALFALRTVLQNRKCTHISLLPTYRNQISEHLVLE